MAIASVIDGQGNLTRYTETQNRAVYPSETIKFLACGDTGAVRRLEKVVANKGPRHVLGEMKAVLETSDIRYINLEAVFSTEGVPLNRVPVFRVKPKAFSLVREINPTVVCLANNHMFDYGPQAFNETTQLLRQDQFAFFGAGATYADAIKPAVIEAKGIKIGFIGFREKESKSFNHNGVITPEIDTRAVLRSLDELKAQADIIVLSLHFGWEYQFYPAPKDVKMCRAFIDHGATIIIGHHPHYPQGVEIYKNGLICYSLGNFIWDQNFVGHTDSGYAIEICLKKTGIISAKIIPYRMNRDFSLKVLHERTAFDEIDTISQILQSNRKLSEKWYYISRDRLIIFAKSLKNTFNKSGKGLKDIVRILKSSNTHRFRYTLISLLFYVISFKFLFYELHKRISKLTSNRTGNV